MDTVGVFRSFVSASLLIFTYTTLAIAAPDSEVPDLAKEIEQYLKASQAPGKAPPFSPEDMAVMKKASEDLAREMPNPGLKPGDKAPDFSLSNAYGNKVSLNAALQNGPVVLTFYRGSWCPFCNMQLHALQKITPQIKGYGASLIAVTPQRPDKSLEQVKKSKLPFEVLSDLDSKVMQAYKLYFELPPELIEVYKKFKLNLSEYNGAGRNVLPVPGTFVIDKKGLVRAAFAETDYKKRMQPSDILAALKALPPPMGEQANMSGALIHPD